MPSPPSELPDVPLIPAEVYESRDRGDLVLFCGAGVSVNAGRPTFAGLAGEVEKKFGPSAGEALAALRAKHFDQYFHLLERGRGNRAAVDRVRPFVQLLLQQTPRSLDVHKSILQLARAPSGHVQLVTTNYDRHFDQAAAELGVRVRTEFAPRLAKPVKGRWNSIVHLHGGLDGGDLSDLVLTSGDFGRAYITERWASRFATTLFERFDVLFLGYSADDVVMRYLLDAHATQSASRGTRVWAIAAPNEDEARDTANWEERWMGRVDDLIPYDPKERHQAFVAALTEWAATIDSPASRRTQLSRILVGGVANLARAGRGNQLKWLLSDAKWDCAQSLYVEREGVRRPSHVEWLDEFAELDLLEQAGQRDSTYAKDRQVARSPLVGRSTDQLALGERASAFAQWMADLALDGDARPGGRSNAEVFLEWVQDHDRCAALHPDLADLIRRGLRQSGDRLPSELRKAWTLIVDPTVNAALSEPSSPEERWALMSEIESGSAIDSIVPRLLHALTPLASFRQDSVAASVLKTMRALRAGGASQPNQTLVARSPKTVRELAPSSLQLRCDHGWAVFALEKLATAAKGPIGRAALRETALGANVLLEHALELLERTGATHIESFEYKQVGSIADSGRTRPWTILPDLVACAGLALDAVADPRRRLLYQAWLGGNHITQRRLALHAAANWTNLSDEERMEALRGRTA